MTRAILAALLCATAAGADTRREWHGGPSHSWIELHAPTSPGAVASITFHDQPVHTGDETFTLTLDGLDVTVSIEHMGALPGEIVEMTAPDGYVVVPPVLQPGEHQTGTAHVYPLGVAS